MSPHLLSGTELRGRRGRWSVLGGGGMGVMDCFQAREPSVCSLKSDFFLNKSRIRPLE